MSMNGVPPVKHVMSTTGIKLYSVIGTFNNCVLACNY